MTTIDFETKIISSDSDEYLKIYQELKHLFVNDVEYTKWKFPVRTVSLNSHTGTFLINEPYKLSDDLALKIKGKMFVQCDESGNIYYDEKEII